MNLYVDDVRKLPDGYIPAAWRVVRTVEEAKLLLAAGDVEVVSLDHDMGACADCTRKGLHVGDMQSEDTIYVNWCPHVEDGTSLVKWMCENHLVPAVVFIHTMNPAGRKRMEGHLADYARGLYGAKS